jgi:drug/metabolite transporter (DMT)-like permease
VSEPLLVRTQLSPSRLRRRLQQVAVSLTLLAAALLAWAASLQRDALSAGFVLLAAAFVLTLAASGLLLRGLRPRALATQLAIGADGTITATRAPAAAQAPPATVLRPVALTPLSVVLQGGGQTLVVWCDSLPADGFRRLSAVARWRVERRADTDDLQQRAA